MASPELTKKRLALAVIDFLTSSTKDGSIPSDDADSIEIATNCIAEAFKVDPTDESAMKDAVGQKSLLDIYTVYEKLMKGKPGAGEKTSTPAAASASAPDENTKEEAEKLKSQGNAAIQKKDYTSAIDFYTKALDLIPLNPIYLSNRAAAYSGSGQHEEAVNDAEMAVAADPKFSKAWSRLGFAKYALGDAKGSLEAYEQGIAAEGNGGSTAMRKGYETAKRKVEEEGDYEDDDEDEVMGTRGVPGAGGMPDLSSLAGMFGGGGGGGMPDLGSMMQNPMMRQMAQSLMSNPESMSALLNNPALRGMMGGGAPGAGGEPGPPGAGRGGGMPDLASLMQDPALMDMAKQFMGGAGGPGAGAGRGRGA